MKFFVLFAILGLSRTIHAQFIQAPIAELVSLAKRSSVPILCRDSTWADDRYNTGTATILGQREKIVALTCEHVVAIKDSSQKTIRYMSDIFINMNKNDGTSVTVRAVLEYADEKNDFALLYLVLESGKEKVFDDVYFKMIPPSSWLRTSDFREGETVLYMGYPLFLGIDKENNPLSRVGIVSQLVKGRTFFLIDGFVQNGHSGSPVFLIRPQGNQFNPEWRIYLIGIATSFPSEFGIVTQEMSSKKSPHSMVILNPGFTFVTSMDTIIPILTNHFKFKR